MSNYSDEFSEYGSSQEKDRPANDYAHPEYYQSFSAPEHHLDQPVSSSGSPTDTFAGTYSSLSQVQVAGGERSQEEEVGSRETSGPDDHAPESPPAHKSGIRKVLSGIGAILVAIGSWLLKLKGLLIFLKFGLFGFSALASVFVYSFIFGWPFAIGLVVSLFIHEMGHAIVMKIKGIPVGSMIFIPMLGAFVAMNRVPNNAKDEAEVGIAGPVAGGLAACVCLYLATALHNPFWASLAYFGFFINLFNLVPIVPLDGGRVLGAVDRRVWIVGFLLLLGYQIWSWIQGNTYSFLLIFVIAAALQLWSRGLANDPATKAYYDVPLSSRILLSILYFGLAAFLFLGMNLAHSLMPV